MCPGNIANILLRVLPGLPMMHCIFRPLLQKDRLVFFLVCVHKRLVMKELACVYECVCVCVVV